MTDFSISLTNIAIACSRSGVRIANGYQNIPLDALLAKLRAPDRGEKDGSHYLRTQLTIDDKGICLPRADNHLVATAHTIIIDCDKGVDTTTGLETIGAPDPHAVHLILKTQGIGHILYGTHSHYGGNKGHRYRLLLTTTEPYTKTQLPAVVDAVLSMINSRRIPKSLIAHAKENNTYAQAWYCPRLPHDYQGEILYLEYLEGQTFDFIQPPEPPPKEHIHIRPAPPRNGEISPIAAFNEQNRLVDGLTHYGYKRVLITPTHEKWLSPDSTSGIAGVTVIGEKFYSHHADSFNDGYWHDAFDLRRIKEGLTEHDAVIKAAQTTMAPNDQTVDAHNKSLASKVTPRPLPNVQPLVLPFKSEMLPNAIKDYVFDIAARQQCPPDFVAVAAICALSMLLGRKALIYPKQFDNWQVTPNQWGVIIGRPSAMKSPSMKEALKPLKQIDMEAGQQYSEEKKRYAAEQAISELEKAKLRKDAAKMLNKEGRQAAVSLYTELENELPQPTRKRLIVNDATIEKLGELLNENPNGLLLERDELAGWLARLSREEFQAERAFYLECFDGNGRYIYDRIGRGTIEINHCTLSVIGGIQPSKIAALVRDAMTGHADDGLIQRFQLAVWPDDTGKWKWIDRAPNQEAKTSYDSAFLRLHVLALTADGEPSYVHFTPEAQRLFITWMEDIQTTARGEELHPVLESHMLKMPQTIAGLALLFEIIDYGHQAVGVEATQRAISWSEYLISHARRLYSVATHQDLDGAHLILRRRAKLSNQFTIRDIQRKAWAGLGDPKAIRNALDYLIDYGYVGMCEIPSKLTGGRPAVRYHWHDG